MAKKQLKIPFKDGRPCKWVKDVHDEERDNYEFDKCLEIYGFVRGCSSAVMILRPADDHGEDFNYASSVYYQVSLTSINSSIKSCTVIFLSAFINPIFIYFHGQKYPFRLYVIYICVSPARP